MPRAEPELPAGLLGGASPRAGLAYRAIRLGWRLIQRLLGWRVAVEGIEHLPRDASGRRTGGWIAAGVPHRTWVDPFVLWSALPAEPRLVFFGDARTMARSPLRRFVVRRLGGVIPIPSAHDAAALATHLTAAATVLGSGAVFCLFPEVGPATPPGTMRRLGGGIGYIALRARAPIVPVVLGGTHELYLGRRVAVRVLPALDPLALAGVETPPAPGSTAEREAVHRLLAGLREALQAPVARAHRDVEPPSGSRRPGARRLTSLFR